MENIKMEATVAKTMEIDVAKALRILSAYLITTATTKPPSAELVKMCVYVEIR
jgi:hypothetical protein